MRFFDFLYRHRNNKIKDYISNGALILDIRSESEYNSDAIAGAENIPLDELRQHVDELKQRQKPIVVYCENSIRSVKAAKFLNLENIDAISGGGLKSLSKLLAN